MGATRSHPANDPRYAGPHLPAPPATATAATPAHPPRTLRWIVPGFVGEGLTLLIGRPKAGKTWLALELAGAVARGGLALGQVLCDQGPALYLDDGNGQRRVDARVDALFPPGSYWCGRDSREVSWARYALDKDFVRTDHSAKLLGYAAACARSRPLASRVTDSSRRCRIRG